MTDEGRSFRFTHALTRQPTASVASGLRAEPGPDPDHDLFIREHAGYVAALEAAGVSVITLGGLDDYPDAVFIEDAALCVGPVAVAMRPGAPSRAGEPAELAPDLGRCFDTVIDLAQGRVEGGDILMTDTEIIVGTSSRTDLEGIDALRSALVPHGQPVRTVDTPAGVLHLKTDCAIVDSETIFSTRRLAESGCFDDYRVVYAPDGEEAAANLIRINDQVLVRTGFPRTHELLANLGYQVTPVQADQAALVDGGLSCLSLRFASS